MRSPPAKWLYLATELDWSRKIVGWALADHLRTELPRAALRMAVQRRRPQAGRLTHHSRFGMLLINSQAGFLLQHYILLHLGHFRLSDLTPAVLDAWLRRLQTDPTQTRYRA